jgi:hypothetical protein
MSVLSRPWIGSLFGVALAETAEPQGESFIQGVTPQVDVLGVDEVHSFFINPAQQKLRGKTGYANGTGGNYVGRLVAPRNVRMSFPIGNPQVWNMAKLAQPVDCLAGGMVTVEYDNIDANAALNWSSVESMLQPIPTPGLALGWACWFGYKGVLTLRPLYVPIVWLRNSKTGQGFGCGYMEVEAVPVNPAVLWKQVLPGPTLLSEIHWRVAGNLTVVQQWDTPQTFIELHLPAGMTPSNLQRKGNLLQGFGDSWPGSQCLQSLDNARTWVAPKAFTTDLPVTAR